jgi:hypothetical protein
MVAASGLFLGLAIWARPFDSLLFALPVLVWQGLRIGRSAHGARRAPRMLGWLALGLLPGAVGLLAYNAAATGSPFHLPFRLLDQSDTLGFGRRRFESDQTYLNFTLGQAWRAMSRNVLLLLTWTFGNAVVVILGVFGLLTGRHLRSRGLLVAMLFVWPLGFLFFWGSYGYLYVWDGGRILGPFYYLPMLVPLAIAGGIGLDRLLHVSRVTAALSVALCLGLAIPIFVNAVHTNIARTAKREAVQSAVHEATSGTRALVFLPGVWGPFLQHPFSFLRNAPDYDGRVVYALEAPNRDLDLARAYPGRAPFTASLPDGYAGAHVNVFVDRVSLESGTIVDVGVRVPRSLLGRDVRLDVALGFIGVDVPIGPDRTTWVRLTATTNGIALSTRDGAGRVDVPLSQGSALPTADTELSVALVQELAGERSPLVQRKVPVRVRPGRVTVLWPGTVTGSLLRPDVPITWPARTPRRAPG